MPDLNRIRVAADVLSLDIAFVSSIASTNQAMALQPFGSVPAAPRLLLAGAQTAGRGRRGRVWVSEPGRSATFSLAYERVVLNPVAVSGLPIVVGVACARVLSERVRDVRLKWPNDLLLPKGKVGGVLVERRAVTRKVNSSSQPPSVCKTKGFYELDRFVIGIGINLQSPRQTGHIGQPVAGLFDEVALPAFALENVVGALAGEVLLAIAQFLEKGLSPFMAEWYRLDALLGKTVVVLDKGIVLQTGRACGLDPVGGLRLVSMAQEVQVVNRSDVSLRVVGTDFVLPRIA